TSRAAASTRPSPSPYPSPASSGARPRRPTPCRAPWSCPSRRGQSRPRTRSSHARIARAGGPRGRGRLVSQVVLLVLGGDLDGGAVGDGGLVPQPLDVEDRPKVGDDQPAGAGRLGHGAGLAGAEMTLRAALVLHVEGGLAQGEVEVAAERLERPTRPGVGAVAQRAAVAVGPHGQRLRRVVGPREGQAEALHLDGVAVL